MSQIAGQIRSSRMTIIVVIAVLTLVAAYLYGFSQHADDVLPALQGAFPPETAFEKLSSKPLLFEARTKDHGELLDYIIVEEGHGYGGPLHVATVINPEGGIDQTIVIDNKETPSWFHKVLENGFFDQFTGRKVSEPFIVGEDTDAVTGATVSSKAFTAAIRTGSHTVGKKYLQLDIPEKQTHWNFGRNETILLVLYVVVLFGTFKNIPKLRYLTLAVGLVFLGFYLRSPISISHLSAILLGYFKPVKEELFWWLLVAGSLLITFVLGKNLYCHWLCPFGATQELVAKIGGINVRLSKNFVRYTRYLSYFLTWLAFLVIFITQNGPLGSYEPFAALFGHEGIGAQWFLLPMVILGSFVLPKFWCLFFCPVGVVLNLTFKINRRLRGMIGGFPKQTATVMPLNRTTKIDCPRKVARVRESLSSADGGVNVSGS